MKLYERSNDKELRFELLEMSAMVFILGGGKEAPDFNKFFRGNGRADIYLNDEDRLDWLQLFNEVCSRFN